MPGSKTSSHHSTVTRTTRVIYVQEISDTFEAESVETSSFVSPTPETGSSTAGHGVPRSTMSESSQNREAEATEAVSEVKSDQPMSRKAELNAERGEQCSAVVEGGGPSTQVSNGPEKQCAVTTGSVLHEDSGLILTSKAVLAETERLQTPALFLQDGLGGKKPLQAGGITTFGGTPLSLDNSEVVPYPQEEATDILSKATFLQHGCTVFCSDNFLHEGSSTIGLAPFLKDSNNTGLPSAPHIYPGEGITIIATPPTPVQDDRVVLQVEAEPVRQEIEGVIPMWKNRVHPFENPPGVGRARGQSQKKPIPQWPNPMERSSRAPKAMQQHSNDLRTLTDSLTYAKFHSVVVAMKATGLFFVPRKVVQGGPLSLIRNVTAQQAYCLAVTLGLFINFIRSLFAFADDTSGNTSNVLFFKLMVSIFFYEAFSRAALAYVSCRRGKKGLQSLFLDIDRVCFADRIIPYENSLRFWIRFFLVLSVFLSASNIFITAFGMYGPPDIQVTSVHVRAVNGK